VEDVPVQPAGDAGFGLDPSDELELELALESVLDA
jgi:hypothetical protein